MLLAASQLLPLKSTSGWRHDSIVIGKTRMCNKKAYHKMFTNYVLPLPITITSKIGM